MDAKEQMVFRQSKKKIIMYLLGFLLFALVGPAMISTGDNGWGVYVGGFGGLGVLFCLVQLMPNSSYLKLTPEGFAERVLFRTYFFKWTNIKGFYTPTPENTVSLGSVLQAIPGKVFFKFSDNYDKGANARKIVRLIAGSDGALAGVYGKTAVEMTDLMNQWLEKYGGNKQR